MIGQGAVIHQVNSKDKGKLGLGLDFRYLWFTPHTLVVYFYHQIELDENLTQVRSRRTNIQKFLMHLQY